MLSEQDKEFLWAAALLHDVEKRSTSQNESGGKISANGHARRGEYTVRKVLYQYVPVPFNIREQIASLVRFHGLPLCLMEKAEPVKNVQEVALRLDTNHLKILAEADASGCICEDLRALQYTLEMFELFGKEQGCRSRMRDFATSAARFHYFNTPDSYIDYVPFDDFKCEVTLLSFVWNATNITAHMRQQLVGLFRDYGAKVKIVYVEKPYEVWRKQNMNREYPLPESVLDKLLQNLRFRN